MPLSKLFATASVTAMVLIGGSVGFSMSYTDHGFRYQDRDMCALDATFCFEGLPTFPEPIPDFGPGWNFCLSPHGCEEEPPYAKGGSS